MTSASSIGRMALLFSMPLMAACNGVSWPSERIVRSLRVLGVQAEPASVTPGKSSRLSLLCADGSRGPNADSRCDVEVAWFGACDNPPNNDPLKCLNKYADWIQYFASPLIDTPESPALSQFKVAPQFEYRAPEDVLQGEVTVAGQTIHYGTSYVFFAVCAGNLVPASGLTDQLPVQCRDRNSGALLNQSRFVVGVTTLYTYDKILNHNPAAVGARFDGVAIPTQSCSMDEDCGTGSGCTGDAQCVPVVSPCGKNDPQTCRGHCLDVEVPASSFVLMGLDGTPILEPLKSLWVDHYANAGALPDDARLGLAQPKADGANVRSNCALWQAPTQAISQARLWLVVRDDRGGLTWREQRVIVR